MTDQFFEHMRRAFEDLPEEERPRLIQIGKTSYAFGPPEGWTKKEDQIEVGLRDEAWEIASELGYDPNSVPQHASMVNEIGIVRFIGGILFFENGENVFFRKSLLIRR